jgi:thioredoxin
MAHVAQPGTYTDFKSAITNSEYACIDFAASWCGPCKKMAPFYHKVASESHIAGLNFLTVDVDVVEEAASEFKINAMPTLVITRKGAEIGRSTGYMDDKGILAFLRKHIA